MNYIDILSEISERLQEHDIRVILSGGSAVAYYTRNRYLTNDFDLIDVYNDGNGKIGRVMAMLGFVEAGRYFHHPDIDTLLIEFPRGPLRLGNEFPDPETVEAVRTEYGTLYLLSATDCIKDRLAAYHSWNREIRSLYQAILVSMENDIDMEALERWAAKEEGGDFFERFKKIREYLLANAQRRELLENVDRFDDFVYEFFLNTAPDATED